MKEAVKFEEAISQHGGLLWRISCSYERHPDLQQELHQEVLTAVWRALPKFRADSKLSTFLARIAHNRGLSHVAKEASSPTSVEIDPGFPSDQPSPLEEAVAGNRLTLLMEAVHQLPINLRQVITLTLEGFAPREIADVLGENANTVSIRLTRAKQMLRHDLKALAND